MMQQTIPIVFCVSVNTKPGETVCVVGNCEELGNWDPHHALELTRDQRSQKEIWMKAANLHSIENIHYRYFTCYMKRLEKEEEIKVTVNRWETNIQPRRFFPYGQDAGCSSDYEVDCDAAIFGRYDGRESISKGWLTEQTEVHFHLCNNPIKIWCPAHSQQKYKIICKTMDLMHENCQFEMNDENGMSFDSESQVEIAVINDDYDFTKATPHKQPEMGTVYNEGDYWIFSTKTLDPENTGYKFYIYECPSEDLTTSPKHVGYAYILPINMQDTKNIHSIPIHGINCQKPLGQLTVEYLKIAPVKNVDFKCDMSVSYAKHWKERPPLEVGHRGMGTSHSSECSSSVTENTVASLETAGSHGADYVEFDVQLSSDYKPVIYHNFEVCLTMRGKKLKEELQLFKVPVKSLNLEQLQHLQLDPVSALEENSSDLHREDTDPVEHQPFPTLEACLEQVDEHVGFNVEIKYPMMLIDGTHEMTPYFDQNEFLDVILNVVFKHAHNRRIVFSCFEPDICAMLRVKQNKYPVQLLTNGWKKRMDPRTWNVAMTTQTAVAYDCLGINVDGKVLVDKLEEIQIVKDSGLVLFVWGTVLNDPNVNKMFKDQGVEGVIYDKISEFKTSENIFKMEYEAKMIQSNAGAMTNGQ